MRLILFAFCLAWLTGCRTPRPPSTIIGRDFEISKIESVDLSAEDWLLETIDDPDKIRHIKQAILSAEKIEEGEISLTGHCQLRIASDQSGVLIGYDKDQGLLRRISIKQSSVYRLSEDSKKILAEIWESKQ